MLLHVSARHADASHPAPTPKATPVRPDLWLLEEGTAYLDHGAYGAVPIPVLQAQRAAAEAVERNPQRFYRDELFPGLSAARAAVAEFLGIDDSGLVLLENATQAVQVALDAVSLAPRSEVIYTDHAYPWVVAAIERACADRGAVARRITLPSSQGSTEAEFAAAITTRITEVMNSRTSLLVLDQITSASALRLPAERVCAALGDQVPIVVDGAHSPGLIDTPVPDGAAFWYGNLHKWAFAARTIAALNVAPAWRERVRPPVASFGGSLGFPESFTYQGTQDPSAYLSIGSALAFPRKYLAMSFPQLRERNRRVLRDGLETITDALGLELPPDDGLPMKTVALRLEGGDAEAGDLNARLRRRGVVVAVPSVAHRLNLRISVQAYVGTEAFGSLIDALKAEGIGR